MMTTTLKFGSELKDLIQIKKDKAKAPPFYAHVGALLH